MKINVSIENDDGEIVLDTHFLSVGSTVDYLARHEDKYTSTTDVIDF